MTKWVYSFGGGTAEGAAKMKELLGGKGANLAEMANLGLPVPPGFTITTEVCTHYYANDRAYPAELKAKSKRRWPLSAPKSAARSVTRRTRCSSPSAPAVELRCRA